jgi:hypothetical protein
MSSSQAFVRIRGVSLDVSIGQIPGHPIMISDGRLLRSQHPASTSETFPPPLQAKQDCFNQPSGSMSPDNVRSDRLPLASQKRRLTATRLLCGNIQSP